MNALLAEIGRIGVVPVVTIDDVDDAVPLARSLVVGGLRFVEITLRTAAGLGSIAAIASQLPDAVVGAGSVMAVADVDAAAEAGARFVVSPGLDEDVAGAADARDLPSIPGIATPTELMRAVRLGHEVVKLFPAEAVGGLAVVSSLAPVWPSVRSCPPVASHPTTPASTWRTLRCSPSVDRGWCHAI